LQQALFEEKSLKLDSEVGGIVLVLVLDPWGFGAEKRAVNCGSFTGNGLANPNRHSRRKFSFVCGCQARSRAGIADLQYFSPENVTLND
jgi:hypothetical protein